jgi:hypothetical protein
VLKVNKITRANYKIFPSTGKLKLFYKEQLKQTYGHRCSLLGNHLIYKAITAGRQDIKNI